MFQKARRGPVRAALHAERLFFFGTKTQKNAAQPIQRDTYQFSAGNRFVPHWFKLTFRSFQRVRFAIPAVVGAQQVATSYLPGEAII